MILGRPNQALNEKCFNFEQSSSGFVKTVFHSKNLNLPKSQKFWIKTEGRDLFIKAALVGSTELKQF